MTFPSDVSEFLLGLNAAVLLGMGAALWRFSLDLAGVKVELKNVREQLHAMKGDLK